MPRGNYECVRDDLRILDFLGEVLEDGGQIIANSLSSKIKYHKKSLNVKWFFFTWVQNCYISL